MAPFLFCYLHPPHTLPLVCIDTKFHEATPYPHFASCSNEASVLLDYNSFAP